MPSWYSKKGEAIVLRLYVQPKASRDKIVGEHGDELKIAITAPPIDGKANAHLIKLLSKWFGLAKGSIHIEKGQQGRHKQVLLDSPSTIPKEIESLL
ncbi:DUF167 family protein YggU [Vibrio ulleungensis]|uniref:UPF0235 protein JQC93_16205 n=1 Tax=Vibrio ulleungensis TaxID=2807619 RepID=A0ABS2HLJ0_9VIBR|nr:DUF167 family protein YggU [Vibrio ulleungensis]MBM7037946.1 YggU family protein [Vibrio ulleungensis]